jgi:hypothetical protein
MESQADGAAQQMADPEGFNSIEMATRILSLVAFLISQQLLKGIVAKDCTYDMLPPIEQ